MTTSTCSSDYAFLVYRSRAPRIIPATEVPNALCTDLMSVYIFNPMMEPPWLRLLLPQSTT